MCECSQCADHRLFRDAFKRRDPDELISIIKRLEDERMNLNLDLGVAEAILDGDWPSAKEKLEAGLAKVAEIEKKSARQSVSGVVQVPNTEV